MADNYLEKRYEEVFGAGRAANGVTPRKPSLDVLLARSSAPCAFDRGYKVHRLQTDAIISVCRRIGAFPEVPLEFITAPDSLILICQGDSPVLYADGKQSPSEGAMLKVGMALQCMILKAAELGLAAVPHTDFDAEALKARYGLTAAPLAVLEIGKNSIPSNI